MKIFQKIAFLLILSNIITYKSYATCDIYTTLANCNAATTDEISNDTDCDFSGGTTLTTTSALSCLFDSTNLACCRSEYTCVTNAHYNGSACVCDDGWYTIDSGVSCTACAECSVSYGYADVTTSNNTCVYDVICNQHYHLGTYACSVQHYASCLPDHYRIILNNNNGSYNYIYEIWNTEWHNASDSNTPITSVTIPTKSGNVFTGYYDSTNSVITPNITAGSKIIDSDGDLTSVSTTKFDTGNITIFAQWTPCEGPIAGGHGTVYEAVINNTCSGQYYIICDAGYESEFDDVNNTSSSSNISCDFCSPGYYCLGSGVPPQPCPTNMTSYEGSNDSDDCHAAPGYYYADSTLLPCPAGKTSDEGAYEGIQCYYSSTTTFKDDYGTFQLPSEITKIMGYAP